MKLNQFQTAQEFLNHTQNFLEIDEATNSLMLGLAIANKSVDDNSLYLNITENETILFAAIQTPSRNLIVCGREEGMISYITTLINYFKDENIDIPGINGPAKLVSQLSEAFCESYNWKSKIRYNQVVYQLTEIENNPNLEGNLKIATEDDLPLIGKWMDTFFEESLQISDSEGAKATAKKKISRKEVYLWEKVSIVAMTCIARHTANGISINYVYTPNHQRKKGYGTKLVAQVSTLMLKKGYKFCTLFADQDNPSTNRIYQRIGYKTVGEFRTVEFDKS